jgi:hypothetical protein
LYHRKARYVPPPHTTTPMRYTINSRKARKKLPPPPPSPLPFALAVSKVSSMSQ